MADDDAFRRPPQAYATVQPAGVGATITNQVSPGTLQDILDTGDQSLIDQAFDQMTSDLSAYLESLPSPSACAAGGVSPAGVGSQASRTPSSGAQTRIAGVLVYLQEPIPHVVGGALDCLREPEPLAVGGVLDC